MKTVISCALAICLCLITGVPTFASPGKSFNLAVSAYAGWMPWYYANEKKILKKWADRYGINITVKCLDYVPSIEAFVAGQADAVVMTNMETLDMPAASGVDSSVVIMGDYSNGNDAILVRDKLTLSSLKGRKVYLAERTVSQYLLSRALDQAKLKESDVDIVNVSESDIASLARKRENVVVTWNPMVTQIEQIPGITTLFDSSEIPGEIQDLLVLNGRVLKANPDLARALVGAWYEVMAVMSKKGPTGASAINRMAELAKVSHEEFQSQLKTTAMFYTPKSALEYMRSPELKQKQDLVRKFCFAHGLLGENVRSVDAVGILYPDGTIHGDKKNIKMRYVDTFIAEAADGRISLTRDGSSMAMHSTVLPAGTHYVDIQTSVGAVRAAE